MELHRYETSSEVVLKQSSPAKHSSSAKRFPEIKTEPIKNIIKIFFIVTPIINQVIETIKKQHKD